MWVGLLFSQPELQYVFEMTILGIRHTNVIHMLCIIIRFLLYNIKYFEAAPVVILHYMNKTE